MLESERIQAVVDGVLKNASYRPIDPGLIRSLASNELGKGRSVKEAIKQTRSKLHQVGKAYQEKMIPFQELQQQLNQLPHNLHDPKSVAFSRQTMSYHRSTEERLPILDKLFADIFNALPTIHTVLDLACGFNPLALPWMKLPALQQYWAYDIYHDMCDFLQQYFDHMRIPATAQVCDLTRQVPEQQADLAIVFKTIPCLEQIDKSIGRSLLESTNAAHILVSYPGKSLSGRSKGMPEFYTAQFTRLCEGKPWNVREWRYESELVFLIEK